MTRTTTTRPSSLSLSSLHRHEADALAGSSSQGPQQQSPRRATVTGESWQGTSAETIHGNTMKQLHRTAFNDTSNVVNTRDSIATHGPLDAQHPAGGSSAALQRSRTTDGVIGNWPTPDATSFKFGQLPRSGCAGSAGHSTRALPKLDTSELSAMPGGGGQASSGAVPSSRPSFNTGAGAHAHHHVGLGLSLTDDEHAYSYSGGSSTRTSIDSSDSVFQSRASSVTPRADARWGLGDQDDIDTVFHPPPAGTVDAFKKAVSSATSSASPTLATRRTGDHGLPRLTTPAGAISPLVIPGGGTASNAMALSPRVSSPATHRSPSPSHGVYNLSSRNSTPTRPQSFIGSVPMDRASSSSKSREIHNRQQSLTSACPPVTSSYGSPMSSSPEKQSGFAAMVRSGSGSSPKRKEATWKWSRSKDAPGSARNSDDDEDPREGAKAHLASPGAPASKLDSILSLPSTLLSFFLAPLVNHNTAPAYSSPPIGSGPAGVSSITKPSKRYPLALRLVVLSYLIFSFCSFGMHVQRFVANGGDWKAGFSTVAAKGEAIAGRIGPRASQHDPPQQVVGSADEIATAKTFPLGSMRKAAIGHWAHKVAEGVRWGRGSVQAEEEQALAELRKEITGESEDEQPESVADWGIVRRMSGDALNRNPSNNPLTPYTHTYRFSKMHDKLHWDTHDEIVSFAFAASSSPAPNDVTACLYSNEAWLSNLGTFVSAWRGPLSLVFETAHSRFSHERERLMEQIKAIREQDELVRKFVDFHIVGTASTTSERSLAKIRERMIERPVAQNYQLNLARFFAPTDLIYVVGDPRIVPSAGLKRRLQSEAVRQAVIERGDIVAVPTFGFIRDPTGDTTEPKFPSLNDLRGRLDLPVVGQWDGVAPSEFDSLAAQHVLALHESLPIPANAWPTRKQSLVSQVNTRAPSPDAPTTARIALFDRRWDLNHGPSNWYLWRKSASDTHLQDAPELGGGVGLGLDGGVGGGHELYKVTDYDMHYSPTVVMSRKGQPWCTERFETMHAACVYQMYLTGAEVWVVPDEWAYTLEVVEKKHDGWQEDPADKLKNSISARLYGKFHQEACMHYGREFLSTQSWNSEKAQHLRETCVRTLNTWGMGLAPPNTLSSPPRQS